jgi:hypothetical protein
MGWMGAQMLLLGVRGPHCPRHTWLGYKGGVGLLPRGTAGADAESGEGEEERVEEEKADVVEMEISSAPARPPLAQRRSALGVPVRPPLVQRRSTLAGAVMG